MVSGDVEDNLASMAGDSLDGRLNHALLRGLLRCLSFWRVLLEMLVMWLISSKECQPPWTSPKALLQHLGVHLSVFMIGMINYERIGALFKVVVVVVVVVHL